MGWLIFAGIVLLFVLLLAARVRVEVRFDGTLRLDLKYLLLSIPLSPAKVKKLRLRDYRIDRFRRRRIKERAKAIKKNAEKAAKDAEKKKKKQAAKEAKKEAGKGKAKPKKPLKKKISMIFDLVRDVGLVFLGQFWGHSHVEVKKLSAVIALGDAAKTAEGFGLACMAAENLLAFLDSTMHLKVKDGAIMICPDYLLEKPVFDVDVVYSISVGSVLGSAIGAGVRAVRVLLKNS